MVVSLGIMWVTQHEVPEGKKDSEFSTRFSAFRSPLGDAVVSVIAPPNFYIESPPDPKKNIWPDHFVYKDIISGKEIFGNKDNI